MRRLSTLVVFVVAAISLGACSNPGPKTAATPAPAISAIPKTALPSWIEEISPTGTAGAGSQIRVRFKNDVIPLDALESSDRQVALTHLSLFPALPGRFIFLTPRMAGFEADAPIPSAMRVRVTLTAGLADLKGNALSSDYAWTFQTEPIALADLTGSETSAADLTPVGLRPIFGFNANTPLDRTSLAAHVTLVAGGNGNQKPVDVALVVEPSPSPSAGEEATGANTADQSESYQFRPTSDLAGNTTYAIVVSPGIASLQGNVVSLHSYRGKLRTYGPLAFSGVTPFGKPGDGGEGRFDSGSPALNFSNGLDAASAKNAVTVAPSPNPNVPLVGVSDGDTAISINPYALAPRTHYTLSVTPTLKDQFGQTLGQTATATFDTADFIADIWAPSGLSVFPSGTNLQLNVETTNLPDKRYQSAYRLVQPQELIANDPDGWDGGLPPAAGWTWQNAPAKPNDSADTPVALRQKYGGATGMLAYGVTARTYRALDGHGKLVWQHPVIEGIVQSTDIGMFAQWFPSGGMIRAARLSDGSPLPNARIEIYQSQLGAAARTGAFSQPCAAGATDAGGTWNLDAAAFAACASTAHDAQTPPELLVIARDGKDWAFVRTLDYSGAYDSGIYAGWSAGAPDPHGTIVSDRSLYQPGETAQFAGVAYFDENGALVRGRSASFAITIESPSGKKTPLGEKSLDAFGAFSATYAIGKRAEVGYYTIGATGSNGEALSGTFRVAEFKPPNFKVQLSLSATVAGAGTSVAANTVSTYLFGAPVEGGKSHYYVTRQQSSYVPAGWESYDFGRSWLYPEQPPSIESDVVQKDVATNAGGASSLTVAVPNDLPFAMDYRVDSETTDVSNLSVADSKTFTAFPSDAMIGLQGDFVATAGKPFDVRVAVLDLHGKPVSGRDVKLVLAQRIYSNATQLLEGSETQRSAVHYNDVQTVTVSSGALPVSAGFTALKPGSYRIRANFDAAASDVTAADHNLWISGPGEFDWGGDQNRLTVKLDKATYRPGDVATALIQSPYADADLFFAVIRHGVIYRATQTVHGPAPQVRFTVTPEMLPNAAVEAVLVRRGKPLSAGVPAGLGKLARAGFAPFEVALDDKYVAITASAVNAQPQPGTHQRLHFRLRDSRGRPIAGELTVAVVNDAVLQLTGYRFPDLVKIVYADQPISTRFADNRALVKLVTEHKYVNKGFGFGGGAMAGAGSTRVRTNFQPLAYWNGALRTDAAGNADADFTLPDDLTTWRVLAIAMTRDARFGNGETSFVATKPLVTNPILPQFARPGDRFSLGVSVTNIGKAAGDAKLQASLLGALTFSDGSQSKRLESPLQGATSAYRFEVVATTSPNGGVQNANVKFATSVGKNADAFAVPLQVRTNDVIETVATSGATASSAAIPLDVPQSPLGGIDFMLASTMLAELDQPQTILGDDRPPFSVAIASRIAVAADTLILDRQANLAAAASTTRKTLGADLDALEVQALPDGGYAPWPGAKKSDIWSTAFVATQLQQAKLAGFDPAGLAHVKRFLTSVLADPGDACSTSDALCRAEVRLEALETLGTLGEPRSDFLSDIWAQHEHFGYVEQVELARLLLKLPDWHSQALALRDKLLQQVYETARYAAVNAPSSFETATAEQSQMLGLLVDSGAAVDRTDKAVSSLLGSRGTNGRWLCLCDDAEAMNALAAYALGAGKPANFVADTAAGSLHHSSSFTQALRADSFSFTIGANGVPPGKSAATLTKKGPGTLHYAVAMRYRVPDVAPGVYSGIRIDRRLHPVNDPSVIASFGLAPVASDAVHVAANRVFEIEDRITSDHALDHVVIEDPLPAGFEAVDSGFRTATPYFQANADDWQIDYQSIYSDRVLSFAHYLPAGVYAVHYLVRSVTPGSFDWPGAQVSLEYAPEELGRTASTRLTIDPAK